MIFEQIIHEKVGILLTSDDESCSGCANNAHNLNSDMLEAIYYGVYDKVGKDAARAFVHMVEDMVDDASVATFLDALKSLETNHWQYQEGLVKPQEQNNNPFGNMMIIGRFLTCHAREARGEVPGIITHLPPERIPRRAHRL